MNSEQTPRRGSRHLKVGVRIGAEPPQVTSIRIAAEPVIQQSPLRRPVLVRVDTGPALRFIDAFDDPLEIRGINVEGRGHSFRTATDGVLHVAVPFNTVMELLLVRIRIASIAEVPVPSYEAADLAAMLDDPASPAKLLGELALADLQAHPDWEEVAETLGLPHDKARFEIYRDAAKLYRWRMRRANGAVVAESGRSFADRAECEAEIVWLKANAARAGTASLDVPVPEE